MKENMKKCCWKQVLWKQGQATEGVKHIIQMICQP